MHKYAGGYTYPYDVRPMIEWIRDNLGTGLKGVEIGVFEASNAGYISEQWNPSSLSLRDHWECDEQYKRAIERINNLKHSGNTNTYRSYSSDAIKYFKDDELDFVYIDANHEYEYVKEDIALWTPKVKKGGVVGGHDYHLSAGVNKAVNEVYDDFRQEKEDWWVVKKS